MKRQTKALLIILIIWAVILFGLIISKEITIQTGKKLMLQAHPVDPRDVFRGDYVVLTYKDLSVIKQADLENKYILKSLERWNDVYVLLDTKGKYVRSIGVYRTIASLKAQSKKGFYFKGNLTDCSKKELKIDYGIENFFLPEGEGSKIENSPNLNIAVEVMADDKGSVVPIDLYINDKKVHFNNND